MRRSPARALVAAALALLAGCAPEQPEDGIDISRAIATEPIMDERAALYLSITNHGPFDDVLEAVSTPVAGRAEIHRTLREDGTVRMEAMRALPVPADSTIALAPGGYHIMLLDLKTSFARGDMLTVTLMFRMRGEVSVSAPVVAHADVDSAIAESNRRR